MTPWLWGQNSFPNINFWKQHPDFAIRYVGTACCSQNCLLLYQRHRNWWHVSAKKIFKPLSGNGFTFQSLSCDRLAGWQSEGCVPTCLDSPTAVCRHVCLFLHNSCSICMYIGFETLFYVLRHLDSIASYLPTGLHSVTHKHRVNKFLLVIDCRPIASTIRGIV